MSADAQNCQDAPSPKVALVTGSSSGIGAATAAALAAEGMRVVVNSARSADAGRALAATLPEATYVQADVGDPAACARLVEAAISTYGRLDVLVNNAGTTARIPHRDMDRVTDELFERILRVNVLGAWNLTRAALPYLTANGAGSIVNMSSIAGLRAAGSSIPYAVSKAALNHLTILTANACGPNVRVNAIAPGYIETPWTDEWGDGAWERIRRHVVLDRPGSVDDVARAVVAVVANTYITGQVVVVDGGLTLR